MRPTARRPEARECSKIPPFPSGPGLTSTAMGPMMPFGDAVPHRREPSPLLRQKTDSRLSIKPVLSTETTMRSAVHDEYAHAASSQSLSGGADESFPFGPFD